MAALGSILNAAAIAIAIGEYGRIHHGLEIPFYLENRDDDFPATLEEIDSQLVALNAKMDTLLQVAGEIQNTLNEIQDKLEEVEKWSYWLEMQPTLQDALNHIQVSYEQLIGKHDDSASGNWTWDQWVSHVEGGEYEIGSNLTTLRNLLLGQQDGFDDSVLQRRIAVLNAAKEDLTQSPRFLAVAYWRTLIAAYCRGVCVKAALDLKDIYDADSSEAEQLLEDQDDLEAALMNDLKEFAIRAKKDLSDADTFWTNRPYDNADFSIAVDNPDPPYFPKVVGSIVADYECYGPEDHVIVDVRLDQDRNHGTPRLNGHTLPRDNVLKGLTYAELREEPESDQVEPIAPEDVLYDPEDPNLVFEWEYINTHAFRLPSGYVLTRIDYNMGSSNRAEAGMLSLILYGRRLKIDGEGNAEFGAEEEIDFEAPLRQYWAPITVDDKVKSEATTAQYPAFITGLQFRKDGDNIYFEVINTQANDPMFYDFI